jgi:hypothetical protein
MESDMSVNDQPTCGKGLAANSALPAKLADLIAATAEVLERHMKALDLNDPDSRKEFDAYAKLARAHRDIVGELESLAGQMAGYRDLPMGRHDEKIMANPQGQAEAFERYVRIEEELFELLRARFERDEQLLG